MNEEQNQNPYYNQQPNQVTGMNHPPHHLHSHQPGFYSNPYLQNPQGSLFNSKWNQIKNDRFYKGMLVGAVATYVLTNDNVQKSIIKSVAKLFMKVEESIEEFKEKVEDVKAEIKAEESK
ncbi:MAG: YtxH domain-containing protein [Leptospiraceae bacterium]|nr:YtxH domain-containing protein [Leptospiraceae bacterium]MCP5496558.1 YtxH domain-containing protein [Leptospiraceae bacterium]